MKINENINIDLVKKKNWKAIPTIATHVYDIYKQTCTKKNTTKKNNNNNNN